MPASSIKIGLRPGRYPALLVTLAVALSAIACESPDVQTDADRELETDTALINDPVLADDARRVRVTLRDFAIEMPDTLAGGMLVFEATNRGSHEHSLAVEGGDVHQTIPSGFRTDEAMELIVFLEPGVYRMYCPIEDHAERGMQKMVSVR